MRRRFLLESNLRVVAKHDAKHDRLKETFMNIKW